MQYMSLNDSYVFKCQCVCSCDSYHCDRNVSAELCARRTYRGTADHWLVAAVKGNKLVVAVRGRGLVVATVRGRGLVAAAVARRSGC